MYSDELLVRGLNTRFLIDNGYKISKVSEMSNDEVLSSINSLINSKNENTKIDYYLSHFIITSINFDEHQFNVLFDKV